MIIDIEKIFDFVIFFSCFDKLSFFIDNFIRLSLIFVITHKAVPPTRQLHVCRVRASKYEQTKAKRIYKLKALLRDTANTQNLHVHKCLKLSWTSMMHLECLQPPIDVFMCDSVQ